MANIHKQIAILPAGKPACGKGTHGKFLAKEGFYEFSVGKMIRDGIAKGDTRFLPYQKDMKDGKLAPDPLIFTLVNDEIDANLTRDNRGPVPDGAARSLPQAINIHNKFKSVAMPLVVILFEVEEAELYARCARRVTEALAKGETPREDDNPETFKKRLKVFNEETVPAMDYFDKCGILYRVDGNRPAAEVQKDITKIIDKVTRAMQATPLPGIKAPAPGF